MYSRNGSVNVIWVLYGENGIFPNSVTIFVFFWSYCVTNYCVLCPPLCDMSRYTPWCSAVADRQAIFGVSWRPASPIFRIPRRKEALQRVSGRTKEIQRISRREKEVLGISGRKEKHIVGEQMWLYVVRHIYACCLPRLLLNIVIWNFVVISVCSM